MHLSSLGSSSVQEALAGCTGAGAAAAVAFEVVWHSTQLGVPGALLQQLAVACIAAPVSVLSASVALCIALHMTSYSINRCWLLCCLQVGWQGCCSQGGGAQPGHSRVCGEPLLLLLLLQGLLAAHSYRVVSLRCVS
jgi:hypothetical protein